MLVALSTIGPTDYKEIEYSWASGGQEPRTCRTALFPLAVVDFFQPEELLLMVTPEACNHKNCHKIRQNLGGRLQLVDIPPGRTEDELWEIFDKVSEAVPEGAEVILDVTHAFRSLPLLIFGVITYLRRTKGVRLERIVYGAYEARETGPDGVPRAPVFDLTVLADLQEWLQAVDAFTVRSDAEKLADLLEEAHRRPWLARVPGAPRRLQGIGEHLKKFSRSLRLLRPLDALEAAAKAQKLAQEVEQEAARWAKPFGHVLSRFTKELQPLAADGDVCTLDEEALRRQLALIKHYVEKDLIVQAVLLGREWLVNWLAWQRKEKEWRSRKVREELERTLGSAAQGLRGEKVTLPSWYKALPEAREAAKLWGRLTDLRNDVAHCAMNDSPAPADSINKRAKQLVQRLERLLS
jgi:CRISPR-associated DxTHG motif protein